MRQGNHSLCFLLFVCLVFPARCFDPWGWFTGLFWGSADSWDVSGSFEKAVSDLGTGLDDAITDVGTRVGEVQAELGSSFADAYAGMESKFNEIAKFDYMGQLGGDVNAGVNFLKGFLQGYQIPPEEVFQCIQLDNALIQATVQSLLGEAWGVIQGGDTETAIANVQKHSLTLIEPVTAAVKKCGSQQVQERFGLLLGFLNDPASFSTSALGQAKGLGKKLLNRLADFQYFVMQGNFFSSGEEAGKAIMQVQQAQRQLAAMGKAGAKAAQEEDGFLDSWGFFFVTKHVQPRVTEC